MIEALLVQGWDFLALLATNVDPLAVCKSLAAVICRTASHKDEIVIKICECKVSSRSAEAWTICDSLVCFKADPASGVVAPVVGHLEEASPNLD